MALARLFLGAELRERWRRQLALGLAAGLIGAVVLAAAAGARRTSSVFDRYEREQQISDVMVQANDVDEGGLESLAEVPGADAGGVFVGVMALPRRDDLVPGLDGVTFLPTSDDWARTVNKPALTAGRMPDPAAADEVFISVHTSENLGLHVGDEVELSSFSPESFECIFSGECEAPVLDGPSPTVRVVGIGRTLLDLEAGYLNNYLIGTPALWESIGEDVGYFGLVFEARLRDGPAAFDEFAAAIHDRLGADPEAVSVFPTSSQHDGTRDAIRAQALALAIVAVAAGIAALVAIHQAVVRVAAQSEERRSTLWSLGVERRGRIVASAATFLPAALGAVVAAALASWATSSLFPTGFAGLLEVDHGRELDGVALAGAAALGLLVLASAASTAVRRSAAAPAPVAGPAGPLDRLGAALAPAPRIGLRWALPRRDPSASTVPTAILASVVGVLGVMAAATYAGNLDHLVGHPELYGWTYDLDGGTRDTDEAEAAHRAELAADDAVAEVAMVRFVGTAVVGGKEMQGIGFDPADTVPFTVVDGRAPAARDEVALGSRSARVLGVGLGDVVTARLGGGGETELRVVGLAAFPPVESDQVTVGAALTNDGLDRLATSDGYEEAMVRLRDGVDRDEETTRLLDAFLVDVAAHPAAEVANLDRVSSYPWWLAGFLAVLAAIAVAHALAVSMRRRRPQVGILRAVGFTRRQVRRAVAAQGLTLALIGLAAGIPLGVAAGRLVWQVHATRLGVGRVALVPLSSILLAVVAALALMQGLASATARWAGRATPAANLREP